MPGSTLPKPTLPRPALSRPALPRPFPAPILLRLLTITALGLLAAVPAAAQITTPNPVRARALERLHAKGSDIPDARVLFYWDEEKQVCIALGIKEGPGELRPGFLVFQGRASARPKPVRMKFEFAKDQVSKDRGLLIWSSCLDGEAPVAAGDQVQMTVRRPRRETETFVLEIPGFGVAGGLDLWNDGEGSFNSTVHIAPLTGDAS